MNYVGLDLGQRRDHSAIAVVERWDQGRGYGSFEMNRLEVRHLERVALGTPYLQVVERVRRLAGNPKLAGQVMVVVDSTGLGAPVVELLKGARLGCEVVAVTITGGERATQTGGVWNVPKADLVAGLQVLLERGQLKIARRLKDSYALVKELLDMKAVKAAGASGRVRYGADGAGEHDDLVIALALGCWRAQRRGNGFGAGPLPGVHG